MCLLLRKHGFQTGVMKREQAGWFSNPFIYTALHLVWWKRGESAVRVACATRPEIASS